MTTKKTAAKKTAEKPAKEKVDAQSTDEIDEIAEAAKHPHELINPILSGPTTRDLNPAYAPTAD